MYIYLMRNKDHYYYDYDYYYYDEIDKETRIATYNSNMESCGEISCAKT